MKILRLFSMLAFVMAMVSCSPVKVVIDMDKTVDFSKYETYSFLGWQNHSDENLSVEDKQLMRDAFIKEFERRGLKKVNSGGDMEISLYIVLNQETAVSGYNDYVGGRGSYNHYSGGWGYGYSSNTYKQRDKLVGTLIMNMYDGKSRNQVWQAIATGTVTKNPDKREKTIPANIASLMRRFPVTPK